MRERKKKGCVQQTHKKSLGEKLLKESLLAYWFIRTFIQYIEYNVPSYREKNKNQIKNNIW